MKYFSVISLGCPKNLVDSEKFNSLFIQAGLENNKNLSLADIILINTCGFINEAKEEAITTILQTAELKKNNLKKLIVTGCLVKRYKDALQKEIPEVDVWVDLKDFDKFLLEIHGSLSSSINRKILTPKHYAYLRISDGCDNKCSYCTIPSIRGELKSESIDFLLEEVKQISSYGAKELIINAQDTTRYGYDISGKPMLIDLLNQIDNLNLFKWIRLLYLHPAHLTETIIKQLAKIKSLVPYFDIPLQHINSDILKSMNRKVDSDTILKRLNLLRKVFPDCAIRTTFITGFPGETRQHFNELLSFVKDFRFTRLGVFTFSDEEDTVANKLTGKVSKQTAIRRKDRLMEVQQDISTKIMSEFIDKTIDVIIDKVTNDENYDFEGRSYLDAPDIDGVVYVKGKTNVGDIVKVKITDSSDYDLFGIIY